MVEETKRLYAQQLSSARPAEPVAGQRKPVVFVVDDSPTVRKVVEITLRGAGFQVVQAEERRRGGQPARQHATRSHPARYQHAEPEWIQGLRLVKSHQKTGTFRLFCSQAKMACSTSCAGRWLVATTT